VTFAKHGRNRREPCVALSRENWRLSIPQHPAALVGKAICRKPHSHQGKLNRFPKIIESQCMNRESAQKNNGELPSTQDIGGTGGGKKKPHRDTVKITSQKTHDLGQANEFVEGQAWEGGRLNLRVRKRKLPGNQDKCSGLGRDIV